MNMCINWKVVAGLGLGAVGLYVVAPQLVLGALPLLVFALCPLSMLLMHGMGNRNNHTASSADGNAAYTCPMHPEVQSAAPGRCPKCGMNLMAVEPALQISQSSQSEAHPPLTREEQLRSLDSELQRLSDRQAALAKEIGRLQAGKGTGPSTVLQQAEQVAREAENHP